MDTSKVSSGEMIAGASGVALFVVMFFPWFGGKATGNVPGAGSFSVNGGNVNAWGAFSFIDILLFLVAVAVVGLVAAKAAGSLPDLPAPLGTIILGAGGFAVLLILFRLLDTPDPGVSGLSIDISVTRKIGIFLGLIAAAGITFGGWTASNESPSAD